MRHIIFNIYEPLLCNRLLQGMSHDTRNQLGNTDTSALSLQPAGQCKRGSEVYHVLWRRHITAETMEK